MTINLNLPDADHQRAVVAFAQAYGYASLLPDGTTNPVTPQAFFRKKVIAHIQETVSFVERETAHKTAESSLLKSVDIT